MIRSKYKIPFYNVILALTTLAILILLSIALQARSCSSKRGRQFEDSDAALWDDDAPLNWNADMVSKSELVHALATVARLDPVGPVSDSCLPPPL